MKSLEEVIKYKLNFLPERIDPFYDIQTYREERQADERSHSFIIYRTKKMVFFNDSFSLMEDITPLFFYIPSCEIYYRENGLGNFYDIQVQTFNEHFHENSLGYSRLHNFGEHRISPFKSYDYNYFSRLGYYHRYTKPLIVVFKGRFYYNLTEEEEELRLSLIRAEAAEEEDSDGETEEELSINDSRTFKLEQCVICLEKEPKVLFCNCGHICICDECFVKKLDNCPVCKTKNTILRIIE